MNFYSKISGIFSVSALSLGLALSLGCSSSTDEKNTSNKKSAETVLDCDAHPACSVDDACGAQDEQCFAVSQCKTALCFDAETACKTVCGDKKCNIAESYPQQIFCQEDEQKNDKSDDESVSNENPESQEQRETNETEIVQEPMDGDLCGAPTCGTEVQCATGLECLSLDDCSEAVCLDTNTACEALCGDDECLILESYPAQLQCATDDDPVSNDNDDDPVSNDNLCELPRCDTETPCDVGDCYRVEKCEGFVCLDAENVCERACGTPTCEILESYPAQIRCTVTPEPTCEGLATCGFDQPCEGGGDCTFLKSCGAAVCIDFTSACQMECGTDECHLLESFPAQISCN